METTGTFGPLYEGFQANNRTPSDALGRLRTRYLRRLLLSDLAKMPEGYEFKVEVPARVTVIILLSPPEFVAILGEDGAWSRIPRIISQHGPQPYTRAWYQEYLEAHGLPYYFLQEGHQNLRRETAEPQNLGLEIRDLPPPLPVPDIWYLNTRYPAQQRIPDTSGLDDTRTLMLTREQQLAVARRFPATNLLRGDKRVLLHPEGFITVASGADDLPPIRDAEYLRRWVANHAVGSYLVETLHHNIDLSAECEALDAKRRRALLEGMRREKASVVNPTSWPNGLGEWKWLQNIDQQVAKRFEFGHPSEVVLHRGWGMFTLGAEEAALPVPIWYPNRQYWNPVEQPEGPGTWFFLTQDDAALARRALSLFINTHGEHLRALQVWEIRKNSQDRIRRGELEKDFTEGIDLVWMPGEEDMDEEIDTSTLNLALLPKKSPEVEEKTVLGMKFVEPDRGFGHDDVSRLAHEPYNYGENNQTAINTIAVYQTLVFAGKKITVNRAVAQVGLEEPHKLWVVDGEGRFRKYINAATVDWSSRVSIDRLNQWRSNSFHRWGWPSRREFKRYDYTKPERDWMFQKITEANGDKPRESIYNLADEFTKKFPGLPTPPGCDPTPRANYALTGLIDRLCSEYQRYNGQQKRAGGRALKPMDTQEGNEVVATPSKRKRSSEKPEPTTATKRSRKSKKQSSSAQNDTILPSTEQTSPEHMYAEGLAVMARAKAEVEAAKAARNAVAPEQMSSKKSDEDEGSETKESVEIPEERLDKQPL